MFSTGGFVVEVEKGWYMYRFPPPLCVFLLAAFA